jgi:hypothetical protein
LIRVGLKILRGENIILFFLWLPGSGEKVVEYCGSFFSFAKFLASTQEKKGFILKEKRIYPKKLS